MYGDMWVEPFRRLEKNGFIELKVILTSLPGKINSFKETFPYALVIPDEKLRNSEITDLFINKNNSIDNITTLYQYLYKYDTILFGMARRNNSFNKLCNAIDYRINYYRIIDGVTKMLKYLKPDVMFFSEIPHNYGAYLLYLISDFMKIRCLIMTMPIELKGRIYVIEGIDRVNERILTKYQKAKEPDYKEFLLPPSLDEPVNRIKGDYSQAKPAYVQKYIEKGKSKFVSLSHLRRMKRRKYLGTNLQIGIIHRILRRAEIFIWHRRLVKEYNALCKKVNFSEKYIYYAMHYQPEQTSLPMAGFFENQYMTLLLLSKHIPEGWSIYVKENPYQFLNLDLHQKDFKSIMF